MQQQITRRRFLGALSAGGLALGAGPNAWAQTAPVMNITVGFPPGGTADSLGRLVASLMTGPSQGVIVENKPGASGQLAADTVRRAAPDGRNLLLTPSSILSLVPHLYEKPMYNSLEDFAPVCGVCDHSFALAVPGNSPINSVAEFIEAAKKRSGNATYATAGAGTGMHFLGSIFSQETGVNLLHVPYRGTAPGLQDLIGGQVFASFNPLPTMLELHRGGRIKILAVSNPTRVASLPDVPTFTELKLPALELVEWYGVFAPGKTPAGEVQSLQDRMKQAFARPEFKAAADRLEVSPRVVDAATLRGMLESDNRRWAGIVKKAGISLDT